MKKLTKRQREITAMFGAVALILVVIPLGVNLADGWNNLLTSSYDYDQIENTTDFYEGPLVDGKETEGRITTTNGTGFTEETPTWDNDVEWDNLVITGDYDDPTLYMNINNTPADLIRSDYSKLRMKFNTSDVLTYTLYAVKHDGVDTTKVEVDTGTIQNESTTTTWEFTPMDLLKINTELNPGVDDESYYQLVLAGYNDTDNLTVGTSIDFQLAWGESSNPWTFSGYTVLTTFAWLSGIGFLFVGVASTPYWNPTQTKGRGGRRRKKSRRRRK